MKNTSIYKILIPVVVGLLLLLHACSPVKYVRENQYLLNRTKINIDSDKISESEIMDNIAQKPNLRILLLFRFHLGLYNMSGDNIEKWYNRWLRTIGEEPVIYDEGLALRSIEQIKQYLKNQGFYDAQVSDTIIKQRKKRVKQVFNVKLGKPYLVKKKSYFTLDSDASEVVEEVKTIIKRDSVNALIKEDENINVDVVEQERARVARMLRNKGYYNFSDRFLHYYADSSFHKKSVDLFLSIHKDFTSNENIFKKYKIRNIYVKLQSPEKKSGVMLSDDNVKYDTIEYANKNFLAEGKPYLRTKALNSALRINKGEYYSVDKVEQTYTKLQSLKQFKFINIKFEEANLLSLDTAMYVDCKIDLRPLVKQSYAISVEGTNSSGNLGAGGKLSYSHRNLLGGAENFNVSFSGAFEKEKVSEDQSYNNILFGVESSLVSPQFLLPFMGLTNFRKKYSPKTALSLGYNYHNTYYFERLILDSSFGYRWKTSKEMTYNFNLIDIDYVEMRNVREDYLARFRNEYIKNSYKSHMVVASSIGFVYSGQASGGFSNYVRCLFESAGNLAEGIASLANKEPVLEYDDAGEKIGEFKEFWGVRYAQYVKADFEYIFKYKFNKVSSIAGKLFIGAAYPYGNLKVLPYEKMYYGGGANGIRAWQVRTLGPGSSSVADEQSAAIQQAEAAARAQAIIDGTDPDAAALLAAKDIRDKYKNSNRLGDMKIEASLEYRFKLFGGLEAALFVDAGNVWSINKLDNRTGVDFQLDRFYKEIAVGTGFGFRYDLNFFLLRCDLGIKMIDPEQPVGSRYVFMKDGYNGFDDFTFNIAIGYPF